ncbi:SDR family oxidoreductase [Streptomyces sp. NBC_01728]|uniref:SDR family oxidoreductase n=1 Tax=unclassified Streptomyces TaxID=2593676 RepID=UPI002258334E|nr:MULTISPECIES: SDR family oxidoreductase [unclassified Streptomyces]MCX4461624.1 SDR family oxidoreductase [Streptomyces sp. NBC_01719]MCX4490533.1 SDR family oxidoreductase [Streptomyces sp. NBC_01728]MCX4597325.1 SDR family oxidoreductase [Streptomyces sp. NBC_01549]
MTTPAESKTVLITGASSGIGEATARRLAGRGHRVLLGARRTERLADLAEELRAAGAASVAHRELDVTSLDSVRAFAAAGVEEYGRIDVLINNAGLMPLSPIEDLRIAEWEQMIDVNLRGVLYGIAAVLPQMRRQAGGHIVNVSSVSGHRVDPTAAVYSATKFAVAALSEGLRQESRDIRVTVVSPGFTQSELTDRGGSAEAQGAARAAAEQLAIPASAIAEAIAFAIHQPANVDVNELIVRPTAQG